MKGGKGWLTRGGFGKMEVMLPAVLQEEQSSRWTGEVVGEDGGGGEKEGGEGG